MCLLKGSVETHYINLTEFRGVWKRHPWDKLLTKTDAVYDSPDMIYDRNTSAVHDCIEKLYTFAIFS